MYTYVHAYTLDAHVQELTMNLIKVLHSQCMPMQTLRDCMTRTFHDDISTNWWFRRATSESTYVIIHSI